MHAQAIGAPAPAADLSGALAALSLVNQAGNQQKAVTNDALLQAIEKLTAASQRNFQAMTEEMGKQNELVAQLKQQLKDQAELHQDKEKSLVERIASLEGKVGELSSELTKGKIEQEKMNNLFTSHTHNYTFKQFINFISSPEVSRVTAQPNNTDTTK